jgi:hypothetical protein
MLLDLGAVLDPYDRRARTLPGFLMVLPVPVFIIAAGLRSDPLVSGLASLFSVFGGPVVLSGLARSEGLKIQPRLWRKWGGPPTASLLRLSDNESSVLCQQRRARVERTAGRHLPSLSEERRDRVAADDAYAAATKSVIEETRDRKKYPLVFKENQNYGYWRNLFGLRPIGITVSLIGGVALAGCVAVRGFVGIGPALADCVAGGLICLVILAGWLWYPTEDRVRQVGLAYAERLLDSVPPAKPKPSARKPR